MRILFLGDVVGRPGRRAIARIIRRLTSEAGVEFVVANGENASNGKGLNARGAEELQDAGVDVVTSGNHIWQHRDIIPYMGENARILRPLNFAPDVPGRGWVVRESRRSGVPVAVINLIGRTFMAPADCPFRAVDGILEEVTAQARVVLVDMHGEATSEKVGMGWFLDGRVSAVLGSHTHVQTADEAILPKGTAHLSDAGMCGPERSILGVRPDQVLDRFLHQMPGRFDVADGGPVLVQGAVVDVDVASGKATAIARVRERVEG
ncbi:MAG: TIGR00282 family metallophosphoesterase [bacterium]|nr:TIGR00282 family metallophosphoesterase [bacterium]